MEDNKRKLYEALSQDYDLGSFEQFSADIADETKRRKLYDATSEEYDYGDYDTFSRQLGFGKEQTQEEPAATPVQQPEVAETQDPAEKPAPEPFNGIQTFQAEPKRTNYVEIEPSEAPAPAVEEETAPAEDVATPATQAEPTLEEMYAGAGQMREAAQQTINDFNLAVENPKLARFAELQRKANSTELLTAEERKEMTELSKDKAVNPTAPLDDAIARRRFNETDQGKYVGILEKMSKADKKSDEYKELEKQMVENPFYQETKTALSSQIENDLEAVRESLGMNETAYSTWFKMLARMQGKSGILPEQDNQAAAARMLAKAAQVINDPSKYEDKSFLQRVGGFSKEFGKEVLNPAMWMDAMTSVEDMNPVRNVFKKVADYYGSVDESLLKGDEIDNLLTEDEKTLLKAYFTLSEAQAMRPDVARYVNAARSGAESMKFVAEMAMTGGFSALEGKLAQKASTKIAEKALGRWVANNIAQGGARAFAGKATRSVMKAGGKTLIAGALSIPRAALMPSTWGRMAQESVTLDENGKVKSLASSAGKGFVDSAQEVFTESMGETLFTDFFGDLAKGAGLIAKKAVGQKAADSFGAVANWLRTSKPAAIVRALGKTKTAQFAKAAHFDGFLPEMGEEALGAAIDSMRQGSADALKDFFAWDNLLMTAESFAPMYILGGGAAGVNLASSRIMMNDSEKKLGALMQKYGYLPDQIQYLFDQARGASAEEISKLLSNVGASITNTRFGAAANAVMDAEQEDIVYTLRNYLHDVMNYNLLDASYEEQQAVQREALLNQMEDQIGRFHGVNKAGKSVVRTATILDDNGNTEQVFIPNGFKMDGEMAFIRKDGSTGFVTMADIAPALDANGQPIIGEGGKVLPAVDTQDLDAFLSGELMARGELAEAQETAQRVDQTNANLQEAVTALGDNLTHKGQSGRITNFSDEGAVFVSDDGEVENEFVPWAELAKENGVVDDVNVPTPADDVVNGGQEIANEEMARRELGRQLNEAVRGDLPITVDMDGEQYTLRYVVPSTIDPATGRAKGVFVGTDGLQYGFEFDYKSILDPQLAEEAPVAEPEQEANTTFNGIPLGEDGEPVYTAEGVTPEMIYDYLYQDAEEGDTETQDEFVIGRSDEANEALKEAKDFIASVEAEMDEVKKMKPEKGEGWESYRKRKKTAMDEIEGRIADAKKDLPELQRVADLWGELREVAEDYISERKDEAEREKRHQADIEKYGVDTSTLHDLDTPLTMEEAVAEYLGNSTHLINAADAEKEWLGKGNTDAGEIFRHRGRHGILTLNGGQTVKAVAEDIVGEYENLNLDEQAVFDEILNQLNTHTKTEMRDVIFQNRLKEAIAAKEAAENASQNGASEEVKEETVPAEEAVEEAPEGTDVPEVEEPQAPVPEAPAPETPQPQSGMLTPSDIVEIYNDRENTKEVDKGKPGRKEILNALYQANPELVSFRNEQDQANAISDVISLARQYPDLAISKEILSRIKNEQPEVEKPTEGAENKPENPIPAETGASNEEMTPTAEVEAPNSETANNEPEQKDENDEKTEENSSESPEKIVNSQKEIEARNHFSEAVGRDLLYAVKSGEKPYKSIVELREKARRYGMEVEDSGATDVLIQELVELGIVKAARALIESGEYGGVKSKAAYDAICRLYEMQPTIGRRSSNRVAMQQYSTPIPLSFVAQRFAYLKGGEVLEPTAGNGMLVFGIPRDKVTANELDDTRFDNLVELGLGKVTKYDATEPLKGEYDVIIANPPFGSHDAVDFDGKAISGLDPIITLRSLERMKDDGRAAIIIGGHPEFGDNGAWKTKKAFFAYLYDHYNVKGVVPISGDLYAKQGTTYPTMMILIDGRRSDEEREQTKVYPPVRDNAVREATTLEKLYDIVNEIINDNRKTNGNQVIRTEGTRGPVDGIEQTGDIFSQDSSSESNPDGADGQGRENGRGKVVRSAGEDTRSGENKPGAETGVVASGERRGNVSDVSESGPGKSEREETRTGGESGGNVGNAESVPAETASGRKSSLRKPVRVEKEKRNEGDKILPYVQHSGARSLESVAPAAMVEAMDASLEKIEKEVGKSIDEFVMDELGYKTGEELYDALAAEQIDSVAMAIYQMKKGAAMIIGDQTGVGKGRQMAALIRWARRQGKKPIFMTQKANLFSDIYRDLEAVGSGDLKPLILNSVQMVRDEETGEMRHGDRSGVMTDEDGNVVYTSPTKGQLDKIIESGKVPDGYDCVCLTYSQLNTGDEISRNNPSSDGQRRGPKLTITARNRAAVAKAGFIRKIAEGNYIMMDESHTAAGEGSNSGAFLQSVVPSVEGVTFSSATFAKRPDTMPLYAIKSAMSEANVEPNELINMIKRGGVTLQEIMARALTGAGQMVRRERDMSDVKTEWKTVGDPATAKRARENYDRAIGIFNAIIDFQHRYIDPFIEETGARIAGTMGEAGRTRGTENFGISNPPFVSQTYNFTKQLMLALKVDAIVDETVKEIEAGRHPVIALENTYESGIRAYEIGDKIKDTSFSAGLLRSLERIMQYTVTDEDGQSTSPISPKQLGAAGEQAYHDLQQQIREATKDIFLSPLDAITEKLKKKGYSVGEISGRKTQVVKGEDGYELAKRNADAKQTVRDFNSGKLDVVIINKSGSTGISLHASKLFKDQRQRSMIIAQPLGDINDYMQMIGRIDRTGQVHRGYYINLSLPVPAETRFNMMLAAKLKSLNANTTTSQESDTGNVEAPDFLNKYGSQVAVEYLRDNPEIYERLLETELKLGGETITPEELQEYQAADDDINKVTGRVALLPVETQEAFYKDISERYNALIKYLDETGENTLKITTLPLRAKTLARKVGTQGRNPNGSNPFAQNSYVERAEVDVLKKPMKAEEIRKVRETLLGGKTEDERLKEILDRVEAQRAQRIASEEERYARKKEKVQKDIERQSAGINSRNNVPEADRKAEIKRLTDRLMGEVEEEHRHNLFSIGNQHEKLRDRFQQFNMRDTYLIHETISGNLFEGVGSPSLFLGFKTAKEGDNITPSTSFAVFATLDGRRRLEIKFTDGGTLDEISTYTNMNSWMARRTNIDNWDTSISNATREERYILTGNVLQAWSDASKGGLLPGRLVSYTDIDGNIKDGILMNSTWSAGDLRSAGKPINQAKEQINDLYWGDSLTSTDGDVEIYQRRGLFLRVPKSKRDGAKYFQDKDLLSLVGGGSFYQSRGKFEAEIPANNLGAILNRLTELGVRVADENEANEWEDVQEEGINELSPEERADDDGVLYRRVDDPAKIEELEKGKKIKVYRSMQVIDGKLYPPMSAKVEGKLRDEANLGDWEEAEEHPEMADENGEFELDKGDGSGPMKVAYAPYIHTRRSPLNEQFSSAYNRPNLVIVESEIPESELESGYTAERSKKSTGEHDWPSGKVSNALAKRGENTRKVILSRWAKPIRIVPNSEVADIIVGLIGNSDIAFPYNVVTPGLREELQKRGVRFDGWQGNKPKNVEELIAGMQPALRREGYGRTENLKSPITRARAITELVDLAKSLGVKFKEDGALNGKGSFNPKTGQIRINIDAHDSIADLQATLLHEAVGHYGLRKLLGKEFASQMKEIYDNAAPSIKAEIGRIAMEEGYDTVGAVEEYLSQLAEDGRFTPADESFWQQVWYAVQQMLRKLGLRTRLTYADMRALLYASHRNLQTRGAVAQAHHISVYNALRKAAELSHEESEDNGPEDDGPSGGSPAPTTEEDKIPDDGIKDLPEDVKREAIVNETKQLYRRSRNRNTAGTAAQVYGRESRTVGSALYEVAVDEYHPVDILTDAIANESGKPISDSERVSDALRETGGKAMHAIRQYNAKFLKPMWNALGQFRKNTGASLADIERYIGLKSGLERNVVLAARDARRDYEAQYNAVADDAKAEIRRINIKEQKALDALQKKLDEGKISDVTFNNKSNRVKLEAAQQRKDQQDAIDAAKAVYDAHVADIEAGIDPRFLEYRKKDYSAITAWANTDDLEDAEQMASDYVDDMETRAGSAETKELWNRINAATKETLRFQYEHDMLTRQQYNDVAKMMKYYVPMRGFEQDTAEDLYNYYVTSQSNDFQPTLLSAGGRKTLYEGPLGNIGAMHSSAVSQGVKNQAKLALLNVVRNRKNNTLATITRAWFVKTNQKDVNGKPIYEVAYPQIPEGADFATRQSIIEQFEQDMRDLYEKGEAYSAHREVDLHGGVVAFERESHKNEHVVKVREGGREYGIIINGNPAAAQAINGVKRGHGAGEKFLDIMRTWTRFLSQMFTTFSVPFWVSNFQRDHGQGLTNAFIRNNKDYLGRYILNRYKAFKVFPMIVGENGLEKALAKGNKVAKLYQQYLENGGPMGQNRIEDNEYFERQMKRYLDNSAKSGIIGGAKAVLDVIGGVGEAIETITRFAVFMTSMESGRSIHESISDAKEISTNFARKGSGRSFSRDELDRMTHADGTKLSRTEKAFVNGLSIGVEICRATIPFFNAAMQGLENKVTNYTDHTVKTLLADSVYLMLGLGMHLFLGAAGGDDDKEQYSHTSDYLRRNNILNPLGGGLYFKWALPQEYRVMFAMGDIIASAMMEERPVEDLAVDAFGSLMQLSPIGAVTDEVVFSADNKKRAAETLLTNLAPGTIAPVLESIFNRDFKGARLYNEGFNENLRAYPGWTKALPTTGKEYVEATKFLNNITGGNDVERGVIDLNPAIVEHLIESYFSGPYQIVVRTPEAIGKAIAGDATIRDIPLLNRILLNANDNRVDAFYSNMYYYFKEKDTEASRIYTEYKQRGGKELEDFAKRRDFKYMMVFKQYENLEKAIRKQGKQAEQEGDKSGKEAADKRIQEIHEEIARRCLDIYFEREEVK